MFINNDLQNAVMVSSIDKALEYFKKMVVQDEASRDPRYFMSLLMRLPQIDQRLFGLMFFRKQAIQSFQYTIKFPDGITPTSEQKKQLTEMKDRWVKSKMHTLLDVTMNGKLLGMAASRLTWGHEKPYGHFVTSKEAFPLTDLDFDLADDDKLVHVDTDTRTQNWKRKQFDENKDFVIRYNPMSGLEKDFPGGLVRINWIRVLLKYWDFFNWARDNEKSAILASYEERFKDRVNEILTQLNNIGESGAGAVPKGTEVTALHKMNSEMIKSHSELEQSVDRALAFSIAGTTSIYEAKGGSYARDMIGYEIAEDVTYADLVFAEREITNQYIIKDYKLNYSQNPEVFPVFEFKKRKIKDMEARSRIITDYISNGIPVAAENVYDDAGLIRPEGTKDVIQSTRPVI